MICDSIGRDMAVQRHQNRAGEVGGKLLQYPRERPVRADRPPDGGIEGRRGRRRHCLFFQSVPKAVTSRSSQVAWVQPGQRDGIPESDRRR